MSKVPDFAVVELSDEEISSSIEDEEKEVILKRPPCPSCGAIGYDIVSKGKSWRCNICGRYFVKVLRRKKIEIPEGLGCPECKGTNIVSKGIEWYCRDCGRWWKKVGRGKGVKKELF